MTAGIPGTGIGGLYYLLLVLWMPFHESWLMLTGRGRPGRWKVVFTQGGIAAGILAALWGEAFVLKTLIYWVTFSAPASTYWRTLGLTAGMMLVPAVATWLAIAILGLVVVSANLLRFWIRWTGRTIQN